MSLRLLWILGILAPVLSGASGNALAQKAATYPSKPIRVIVPFAPGGTSDILARSIGQKLTEMWGQQIVVDNQPGADGNIGADIVAKAPPDGYTLVLLDVSALTIRPVLYPKLPYDPVQQFAPVTMIIFSPHALAVHPSVPAKSVKELIAYAKAHPGKLNFGSSSNAVHLAEMHFKALTGTDMTHVPYKGGAAALTALAGGEVDVVLNGLLATLPHIKGGRIRGLAVASVKRMPAAPHLPTVSEAGVPGFVTGTWQGLLAPARTPNEVVAKLNTAVVQILNTPEMKERMSAQGAEIVGNTPEQFGAFIREDIATWTKVAKDAGVKVE